MIWSGDKILVQYSFCLSSGPETKQDDSKNNKTQIFYSIYHAVLVISFQFWIPIPFITRIKVPIINLVIQETDLKARLGWCHFRPEFSLSFFFHQPWIQFCEKEINPCRCIATSSEQSSNTYK